MTTLENYFKEKVVQIALVAVTIKMLLTVSIVPSISLNLDFLLSFGIFAVVIAAIAHLMRRKITPGSLFLIGFFSIIIFNQGLVMLKIVGAVPFMQDILVGVEMGLLVMLVGYWRGIRRKK